MPAGFEPTIPASVGKIMHSVVAITPQLLEMNKFSKFYITGIPSKTN